jgi:hypothetical protein
MLFTVISALLVTAVYSSYYMSQVFVEAVIDGDISCSPQGNGKTYCCADILDKNGHSSTTYCTMCDDTKPPSNCSKREQPMIVQDPGNDLSKTLGGGILKNPKGELSEFQQSNTTFSDKVGPKSGGVFKLPEESKTFNDENNTSND